MDHTHAIEQARSFSYAYDGSLDWTTTYNGNGKTAPLPQLDVTVRKGLRRLCSMPDHPASPWSMTASHAWKRAVSNYQCLGSPRSAPMINLAGMMFVGASAPTLCQHWMRIHA